MDRACRAEAASRRRAWAFVAIPAAAFGLGILAAAAAAKSRGEPFRGVYRQEAVAVAAPCSGRIVSFDVPHGSDVTPGKRIATLEDAAVSEQAAALKLERERLARELAEAEGKVAVEAAVRTETLEKERLETRLRYADLLRARLDVRVRRKALEGNGEGGGLSVAGVIRPASAESSALRLKLSEAANEEEVLDTQIALCDDRLAEIERSIGDLPARIGRALGTERLRADLTAVEERIAAAAEKETAVPVSSPAHGRVGVYRRKAGELVATGETIVEVFDAERPYVLVTVPLAEARRLEAGRRVRVEFEGMPTRKELEGRVADASSEAERDADAATVPDATAVQVRIVPAGRLWPVPPPGTTAVVTPEG
jgi:multidrug resistance efflux pump